MPIAHVSHVQGLDTYRKIMMNVRLLCSNLANAQGQARGNNDAIGQ